MLDGELTFVPGEIPRQGVFAVWGRGSGSTKLELVFPRGTHDIRKRMMAADLIPLTEALPGLLTLGITDIDADPGAAAAARSSRQSGGAPSRSAAMACGPS